VQFAGVGALVYDVAHEGRAREQVGGQLLLVRGVCADSRDRRARPHVGRAQIRRSGCGQARDQVGFVSGLGQIARDERP
jgi:hypothetical protein